MFAKTVEIHSMTYLSKRIVLPSRDTLWPRDAPCVPLTNFQYTNGCFPSLDEYGLGKRQTDALAQTGTLDQLAALLVLQKQGSVDRRTLELALLAVTAARRHSVALEASMSIDDGDAALARLDARLRSIASDARRDAFLIDYVGPLALSLLQTDMDAVDKVEKADMAVRIAVAELVDARATKQLAFLESERAMARSAEQQSAAAAQATNALLPTLRLGDYLSLTSSME
jgi:hypothetical protein